jgi:hypothetical protein
MSWPDDLALVEVAFGVDPFDDTSLDVTLDRRIGRCPRVRI